jgi:hypothetical protein
VNVYNPLDIENLGVSVLRALVSQDPVPLGDINLFEGAGIYALYYTGDFPAYELVAEANAEGRYSQPIYVGKAIPSGGRKGVTVAKATKALSQRLREHAGSIRAAENLDIEDFTARYLVVEPIWIPLGESLLIARTSPVWNAVIDGFGNHDPGKGRINGLRPMWDTLHPGRSWAEKYPARADTADSIALGATEHLRARLQV